MTSKRRLIPEREVRSMAEMLREMGFALDGPIEIRSDGVTFHPTNLNQSTGVDDYEKWSRSYKGSH